MLAMRTHLIEALDRLGRGDLAGADQAAGTALAGLGPEDGDALHVMGLVRLNQGRADEAAQLLERAYARKRHPSLLLHLGQAQAMLRQPERAIATLSEALAMQPDLAEAWYERGNQRHLMDQTEAAESDYRRALALAPAHGPAILGLGRALLARGQPAEAEAVLAAGRQERQPELAVAILEHLIQAQLLRNRKAQALESIALLQQRDPRRLELDGQRVDLLLDLARFDEALAVLRVMIDRDPTNTTLHHHYNDVLYELGREDELLASYDAAPQTTAIRMSKALFVLTQERGAEAETLFRDILEREPHNLEALVSVAAALDVKGEHAAAMALLEPALARMPDDPSLQAAIASTALYLRDPEKAAAMLQRILARMPYEHTSLARLGTAWRMMGDARDETLMGYDDLIRVFDLEPPKGFSSMAAFNQELEQYLATLHPPTREFLGQSLRGGTQTRRHLFGAGHELVDRLRERIVEAVGRYVADLRPDPTHPLRARRAGNFGFAGSWSSRLADCGFHVNHIHPQGWLSSCYYAGVPDAVKDKESKQGWIKFGEPAIDVGLSFRHAIQPRPGRLVLFPSYMWHGTIPFHAKTARTTIAFDIVPK